MKRSPILAALLLVARSIGLAHDRWRSRVSRRRPLSAEIDFLHERIESVLAVNELLRARFERVPPARRPHYKPWERLTILWHAARYNLSLQRTSRTFLVSVQTILNWKKEATSGVPHLVQTRPPAHKLPDLIRHLAHRIRRDWPDWGTRKIAGILLQLGVPGSRSSVQRILRKRPPRRGPIVRAFRRGGRLRAKRPGHVYVVDFTCLKSLFRTVVVGAVIDAFSRKVLAIRVSRREPDGAFACTLHAEAVRSHGKPLWVVSDRGTQFTSRRFRTFLGRRRIRRRFSRLGDANLSRIDRFWRSMKGEYVTGLFLYRSVPTITRDLQHYTDWFNRARPHAGLRFRTPNEAHRGRRPKRRRRIEEGLLEVRHLFGDRRLPVFRLRRVS